MAQVTHGIRQSLSSSFVYNIFSALVGADRARKWVVAQYFRPQPGMQVIDIGCGTGVMVKYMPKGIRYVGFDLSPEYIQYAKAHFGDLGEFFCANVANAEALGLPKADLIIANGVLHHLDDALAIELIGRAAALLAPGGRFVALDGCFEDRQSPIARWLLRKDRGQNVRTAAAYLSLAERANIRATLEIRHDLLRIPYTHSIMECSNVGQI